MSDPDLAAALAVLEEPERAVVQGFAETVGLEPDEWTAVPALRVLVVTVAALRLSAEIGERHPTLSGTAALREACAALGAGEATGRVAARIDRALRRWTEGPDKMSKTTAA